MGKLYISDNQRNFVPHASLLSAPYPFEIKGAKGGIFYLPFEGQRGGDTFFVVEGDSLCVSLMGDMMGHGAEGREILRSYTVKLEEIANLASQKKLKQRKLATKLASLDKELGIAHMQALSLVRVSNSEAYLLNEGENQVVISRGGEIYNPSREISHGKLGILHMTVGDDSAIRAKVIPYKLKIDEGDNCLYAATELSNIRGNQIALKDA